ncbi:MAG: CFI-box-CTERM domain-containing protein [archaeon]|nr:CFI-box-CTERM domain-containing protein [archaeon]
MTDKVSSSREKEISNRAERNAGSCAKSDAVGEVVSPSYHGDSYRGAEKAAYDAAFKKGSSSEGSSSSGGSSGGGGLCYLTTACTKAKGLPDDCLELSVLRCFRDKILISTSKGRKAVREYYEVAPEIVNAVNGRGDVKKIWQDTYEDVRHAVSLVLLGDFNAAFRHYQRMSLKLKEKYLV